MRWLYKYVLFLALFLCFWCTLRAQEKEETTYEDDDVLKSSQLAIRDVFISGNKITKEYIIAREVPLKKGEKYSISSILANIPQARENLINTGLFIDATVDFTNWMNDSLDIVVDVKERWYFFPVPYFKPVDRNFNVWIKEYDASLSRVNYGLKLIANNVSGRNDKLNIWLITGYSRQVVLNYTAPNFDKSLKNGISLDFLFSQNKELNYITSNNKQQFYKNDKEFVTDRLRFGMGYSYRTGYIRRHNVKLSYNIVRINDSIFNRNPEYFGNQAKKVNYPELSYQYQHFNLNYIPYPTKGFLWDINFMKRGISRDLNVWEFSGKAGKYWEVAPKYFFSMLTLGNVKLPFDQPFFNRQLMGYNDLFLRGLENYVVDGVAGGLTKATFSREIWSPKLKTGLRSRSYGVIPFKFYFKVYGDAGYAYSKKTPGINSLNNKLLYSGGAGLDIISIYDAIIFLEYSFNQLGEKGLFLQARLGF
ncbi:MAG: hypothetical protein KF862_25380 [Chitinophagaceae bacterium]|nr:hypothetical protein [Chitinophagaceae bacterium]